MIAILDLKSTAPSTPPAGQYGGLFVLSFLAFLMFFLILKSALNLSFSPLTGVLALFACALIVSYAFVKKYKRLITAQERTQIIKKSLLHINLMIGTLFALLISTGNMDALSLILGCAIISGMTYSALRIALGAFIQGILSE